MRRPAALLGALACTLVLATDAHAATSHCSPSGDFCYGTSKRGGVVRLVLNTFAHRGRVRACVTTPGSERTCKLFRLRAREGGVFGVSPRWSAHFPNGGPGTYRVRFFLPGGAAMGPSVTFRIGG